ncbi:hypothetical protein KEM44_20900 [Sinorhizobium meliloti]|uniref:hypothetical protein n=1 Tax=Rhizobium meliloti TaxID=382 RepID=UPI000B5A2566|nr:hypothetical protein [Sinorhizobium meliloti]ASJ58946.1 hypothetical protein SMB554_06940 [Sinorhizobium meliloti]MCK3783526.1 hypothetical protein [Sinorhizobium meliloti]MCK3787844.1 hypothetical protein [Sinorhizobium meliloti]MCK3794879.1 hypothetical protein [Sinorhizobium meliloti]UTG98589.1 hypothetical protein KEM44_20900 [Sinorhizobium meliloti]
MNKEDRKDLVERLRNTPTERTWNSVGRPYDYPKHLPIEAADEIERLQRELAEFTQLFEQRWNTDLRAKKRWQDAHPDKPNIWPSRDDLLVWLMDQHEAAPSAEIDRLRRELEEARRALEKEPTLEMIRAGEEAYWRKHCDMTSPTPMEEPGIGPIGYAYIAMRAVRTKEDGR